MVYRRLRDLREDRDLLQKDIAEVLQCSQVCYSHYELGKRDIRKCWFDWRPFIIRAWIIFWGSQTTLAPIPNQGKTNHLKEKQWYFRGCLFIP